MDFGEASWLMICDDIEQFECRPLCLPLMSIFNFLSAAEFFHPTGYYKKYGLESYRTSTQMYAETRARWCWEAILYENARQVGRSKLQHLCCKLFCSSVFKDCPLVVFFHADIDNRHSQICRQLMKKWIQNWRNRNV